MSFGSIWNTDQSGFEYEMTSARTISIKGEKETLALVQNKNATTHSYSIQAFINSNGYCAKKLFIVLQEKGGKFGPLVKERMQTYMPPNVVVKCSSSGKLSNYLIEKAFAEVLKPETYGNTLVLQDSWSGQTNMDRVKELFHEHFLEVMTLPPKSTKYIQPLDVYFFRQYKIITRRLTDAFRISYASSDDSSKIYDREFVIRLQSFTYNQICSPKFRNMIMYAWKKSGYNIPETIGLFQNVNEVCFFGVIGSCTEDECLDSSVIICSTCSSQLFESHCLYPLHLHIPDE